MKAEDFLKEDISITQGEEKYHIRKLKIREDYVYLYLDPDEELMISVDAYFDHKIKDRKGLDEQLFLTLKKDEKLLKAYRSCLRKLAAKDHSIAQIREFLNKKDLEHEDLENIIRKLVSYGLLDDEKYTQNRVAYYERNNESCKAIRTRLRNEGVSEELIGRYLHYDHDQEINKISQMAEKYLRSIRNRSKRAMKEKLITRLIGDGFTYDDVRQVTDDIEIVNENEDELLTKEYEKALNKYAKKYTDYDLSRRIYAALLQKGFDSGDIRKVMDKQDGKTG